jgi:hypothetical protein
MTYRRLLPASLWFGLLLLPFAACDGCDDGGETPCDTLGDACEQDCVDIGECPDGTHCADYGKCFAECLPGDDRCGEGFHCDERGRCKPGEGGDGGGTTSFNMGGGNPNGGGISCANVTITFEPQIPTVILLIDQSGSMTEDFGGGNRWDVLYDTLMDDNDGIVKQLEDEVRFGLALYTGDGGGNCPQLTEVSIAMGNHAAIDAVYGPAGPEGETPTGDSIDAILPTILAINEPGQKAIVLATDGEPDTCEQPNPQNGQAEAIAAAQAAWGADVALYIIAVGNDVSETHQQDMANAGLGLPLDGSMGNAQYYPANDQSALQSAFEEIINGVRSCILDVSGSIDPEKADQGTVTLDGEVLVYGDPNGWQLNSPTEIELVGAACEAIQEGDHTISGVFPCDAAIPQ